MRVLEMPSLERSGRTRERPRSPKGRIRGSHRRRNPAYCGCCPRRGRRPRRVRCTLYAVAGCAACNVGVHRHMPPRCVPPTRARVCGAASDVASAAICARMGTQASTKAYEARTGFTRPRRALSRQADLHFLEGLDRERSQT
ncbi:hypothetical protein BD310DRAFT_924419 [Dichomitus squalens]|uniref:Uncharacterized protein n=1 Tax=Dichomitus squalens TaxID=114155 RepID=A0A4Q9PYG2_9APHY|nr:hypothetical protein BD310DRAFT_924419 [Dichomitus squalens]